MHATLLQSPASGLHTPIREQFLGRISVIMILGDRLRQLRELKNLSQGDIERRTGLLRCYVSRVENGHTVPAVETLEKFARALDVPMYQLFYDGENSPSLPNLPGRVTENELVSRKDARLLDTFSRFFSKMDEYDRGLFLFVAKKMFRAVS